jgi:hypothetical protein
VVLVVLTAASLGAVAPGAETVVENAPILDRAGDANAVDGISPRAAPATGPASVPWADITKVWFTTAYRTVAAREGGVVGTVKVPQGITAHVETSAPIVPAGPGIAYVVEWGMATCPNRIVMLVPGSAPGVREALLTSRRP